MAAQQQQNASFAKRLGAQVSRANAEYKDKPVELGNRRLPPGIRAGVAKLSSMYTKEQTEEKGRIPKGEIFFRASAVVLGHIENGKLSETFHGEKIAGMVTSVVIPLCNIPAKGRREEVTFLQNYGDMQNLIRSLGIPACPETQQTDPDGTKAEKYWFSVMSALTNPAHPVYVSFSTRGWTPPSTVESPNPSEMTFETWNGLVKDFDTQHNPAAGVQENGAARVGAPPQAPPDASGKPTRAPTTNTSTTPPPAPPPSTPAPAANLEPVDLDPNLEAEVDELVPIAVGDPDDDTEEGAEAQARLEELAWAAGATEEQTKNAANWAEVGRMALGIMPGEEDGVMPEGDVGAPAVDSVWKFSRRTKDGAKLKNNKGEGFPPQEVQVVSVDADAKTCTVKTVKDGKDVMDLRTKKPAVVKWEWLEPVTY